MGDVRRPGRLRLVIRANPFPPISAGSENQGGPQECDRAALSLSTRLWLFHASGSHPPVVQSTPNTETT